MDITDWKEEVASLFDVDFYDDNEDWVLENPECDTLMEKLYQKGVMPEDAADIIQDFRLN